MQSSLFHGSGDLTLQCRSDDNILEALVYINDMQQASKGEKEEKSNAPACCWQVVKVDLCCCGSILKGGTVLGTLNGFQISNDLTRFQ